MIEEWPEERKAYYRALINDRQPWKKSTGPITEEGTAISSQNAVKHGMRSAETHRLKKMLSEHEDSLHELKEILPKQL